MNNLHYKNKIIIIIIKIIKKNFKDYSRLCIASKVSSLYSALLYGAVGTSQSNLLSYKVLQ